MRFIFPILVFGAEFSLDTSGNTDVSDITLQVSGLVASSGLSDDIVLVYVPGSTVAKQP